jgi:hypothetical protein
MSNVDVERAPFPCVASRLSAASSNTRAPPLIRPYPPRHFFSLLLPRLLIGRVSQSLQSQKTHIGLALVVYKYKYSIDAAAAPPAGSSL